MLLLFEKFIHRKKDAVELENYCIIVNELYARLVSMQNVVQDPSFIKNMNFINSLSRLCNRIITLIDVYKTNKFALPSTMLQLHENQKQLVENTTKVTLSASNVLSAYHDFNDAIDPTTLNELTENAFILMESVASTIWYLEYDVVMINTKTDIIDRYYKRKHNKNNSKAIITVKFVMPNREYINSIKGGNNDAERE